MIPILYDKDKTTFTRDSIGFLTDCISCTVDEERNDQYELEMVYPVGGVLYEKIEQDAIIKAKPNNQDAPQPFRIYRISKQLNGRVTVYARHIAHDLSKVTVEPFTSSGTIEDAIQGMIDHAIPSCGFIFDTEKTTEGNYKVSVPTSFRALMGGVRGSLLDVFGTGEYHYDEYNIDLLLNRGQDRGVVIRYGISMVDMKQEEECENVYTAVYPYWQFADKFVSLNERIISVGEFPFSRIMILDLSSEFQNEPTQEQLRTKAQQYINEHDIGIPSVSLEVDFTGTEAEQDINLCDLVTVEFEKYGIESTAKCVGLTYDVLAERVKSVKLGNYKHKFIQTVADQMKGITDEVTIPATQIEEVIKDITDNGNGYVLLHSSDGSGHIDELLLLVGTPNLQTVQKLWRWNKNGLGYSSTGYNGVYSTAIDMSGRIVASMVKTGIIRAIRIQAGNGKFVVTPDGYLTSTAGYIGSTSDGLEISADYIRNTNFMLYSYGMAFIDSSNNVMAILGKAGSSNTDEEWWITPAETLFPGIGMFYQAGSTAPYMAIFYYDNDASANKRIMHYPQTVKSSDYTYTYTEEALSFAKNIYMNGHKFLASHSVTAAHGFYPHKTAIPTQRVTRQNKYIPISGYKNIMVIYNNGFTPDACNFTFTQAETEDWRQYNGIFA